MVTVYFSPFPVSPKRNPGSLEVRRLLAAALSHRFPHLGELPAMEKDAWGKPFFPQYPELFFSLSHTRGGVCCALADAPVGVDVEGWRPRKYQEQILRRFSKEEQRLWAYTPQKERERLFFQLWVLKESYVKADGRGLRIPLDSFSVLPEEKDFRLGNRFPKSWSLAVSGEKGEKEYTFCLYDMEKFSKELAVCSLDGEIPENICILPYQEESKTVIKKTQSLQIESQEPPG
ncbi:MAG: 4'-phosphopantetheinyl transferase superfamily protein [Lachnospiraceae bacterium]|nr:4'-phosphopantetheinyl transferase superfamily protein [Lachnospiraceae bacterium]